MEPQSPITSLKIHYYKEENYDYQNMGADWPLEIVRKGTRQSPIDIPHKILSETEFYDEEVEMKEFEVILGTTFLDTQIVTEHLNFTVPIPEGALRVIIEDIEGTRKDFHAIHYYFHAGSQHTINGKRYDAEIKLVTRMTNFEKSERNTRGNFSILLTTDEKEGAPGLNSLFEPLLRYPKPFKAPVEDLAAYLAAHARFFAYRGSMTVPPCTENVNWYILTRPAYISPENLKLLQSFFSNPEFFNKYGNVRMAQPLNDRVVKVLKSKAFDEEHILNELPDLSVGVSRSKSFSVDDTTKVTQLHLEYFEAFGWDFTKEGDNWSGDLCQSFLRQSPIDIPFDYLPRSENFPDEMKIRTLQIKVDSSKVTPALIMKGHLNFKVSYPSGTALIEIEGPSGKIKQYDVNEYHFHADSEHTFNGKKFEAELHVVTRKINVTKTHKETRAVFGILLTSDSKIGEKGLESVCEGVHLYPGSFENPIFKIAEFISKNGRIFAYKGSLTTPPCSENVNWHVLAQPAYVKKSDLKALRNLYTNPSFYSEHGSARRTQPLNDRKIQILRKEDY